MKKDRLIQSASSKLSLLAAALILSSCASTSQTPKATTPHVATKDGFASESVREAYLRLKKTDYTEQDKKIDEEESAKIAKAQSKSMITGASTLDGLVDRKD